MNDKTLLRDDKLFEQKIEQELDYEQQFIMKKFTKDQLL